MSNFDAADLTIGDVAERTGIPASTLRMWEARYGFPDPRRSGGTHRRYTAEDCRAIVEVKRARERGLTMSDAVQSALATLEGTQDSLFNGLRARHPDLPVLVLPHAFMLALSAALETTALDHPGGILVGAYQRTRALEMAAPRWTPLTRTAHAVVSFADFSQPKRDCNSWRIPAPPGTALAAEWAVVCDTPRWWGCLVGREVPGAAHRPPRLRAFEAMWSLDPVVVRDASRIAAALASAVAPEVGDAVAGRLRLQPRARPSTLGEASHFTNRVLQQLLGSARAAAARGA
jgi:DNA-binding transcriptional MerR regulator